MIIWSLLYISDYTLTLACARLYRRQETITFEGSYEITPFYQRDIDSLRVISPRFVFMLLLILGMLSFLWVLNEGSPAPELWQFVLGALIGVQLAVHLRHLRNLFLFRSIRDTNFIRGRIEYSRHVILRASSWECFAFSGLFLMLFIFTGSWFVLGAFVASFSLGLRHRRLAGRLHAILPSASRGPQ